MKLKIIIIIIICSFCCNLIYKKTICNVQNILLIDESPLSNNVTYQNILRNKLPKSRINKIKKVSFENTTIKEINRLVDENIIIDKIPIQNQIATSNYIVLMLGNTELEYKLYNDNLTEKYINNYITEYASLIKKIKNLNNMKIIVFGSYIENNKINKINQKIYTLCQNENITFIDSSFVKLNYKNRKKLLFHTSIANKILKEIKL